MFELRDFLAARFGKVNRAREVYVHHFIGVVVAVGDRTDRCQMDDDLGLDFAHGRFDSGLITEIADGDTRVGRDVLADGRFFASRDVALKRMQLVAAALDQSLEQPAADKSGCSGDEHSHYHLSLPTFPTKAA